MSVSTPLQASGQVVTPIQASRRVVTYVIFSGGSGLQEGLRVRHHAITLGGDIGSPGVGTLVAGVFKVTYQLLVGNLVTPGGRNATF